VNVPSELILEQVNKEAKLEDSLRAFDPLIGDLLAPFHVFDGPKRPRGFIAFRMGESGCDLSEDIFTSSSRRINANVDFSNLEFSPDGGINTEPSHYPAKKFETPICQIVSSPTPSNFSKGNLHFLTLTKEVCHAEQNPWWALGHLHRPHCYHCPCQRPSRARGQLL
jgi:hypothetical protein